MKRLCLFTLCLLLSGCALLRQSDPVSVSLVGLAPLPGQDLEMRIAVQLRVQNPNDTPISYDGIALNLDVNGQPLAAGVSDAQGQVGRFGEAVISVPLSVSAFSVLRQALALAGPPITQMPYALHGKLGRGLWPAARFEAHGTVDLSQLR